VRAVELTAEGKAPEVPEVPSPSAETRRITLRLDAQGKILAEGKTVEIGGLQDLLADALEEGKIRLEIVIEVDRQCLFQHVAAVQDVCKEAGVESVRVQALTASPD
jgi:biopolymer transport protein ExbD